MDERREASDRRCSTERRGGERRYRRSRRALGREGMRAASFAEQSSQYVTRLLFVPIVFVYFHFGLVDTALRLPLIVVDGVFLLYVVLHLAGWWHAARHTWSPWRWRLSMWLDLATITLMTIADPAVPSAGFLVYVIVMIGNGIRYGLRFFSEGVVGCIALALTLFAVRFDEYAWPVAASNVLFMLFGAILLLYSYALMARAERARHRLEVERGLDELTGLLNRRAFQERAEPIFRSLSADSENRRLAVLFADLDGFKAVNDSHGHQVGDRTLAQIARLLAKAVRDGDLVARYGGDEFVLLLPESDVVGGEAVARRLQRQVREWADKNRLGVSVSFGVGDVPGCGTDLATTLASVDQAMYQGKYAGERDSIRVAARTTHH